MFWRKNDKNTKSVEEKEDNQPLTVKELKKVLANMYDAVFATQETSKGSKVDLIYMETLIDSERLNEAIVEPIQRWARDSLKDCIESPEPVKVTDMEDAKSQLMTGSVLIYEREKRNWWAISLESPIGRSIETSESETIMYGSKDSFTERIDQNITLLRRRIPITSLKTETFEVGTQTRTKVILAYIEGLTNPEFVKIARDRISKVNYDQIIDSSQLAFFLEDNNNTVFPQFQQSDHPDVCSQALGAGHITIFTNTTPFALNAPITFFTLFQSPEDYINRWPIASFLRILRYVSFFVSMTMIPIYVALTTYHYQMLPLQILFVLAESRGKLPFHPFWESLLILIVLEIIKEASLRMPTKSSQTLGVIGGIVIGQASVEAGFVSQVLIVLAGISAIASFLVPNYLMTKANTLIQFAFLVLAALIGILGVFIGILLLLIHLNGMTSLKQPYLAPVTPFHWKDWLDLFIRAPLKKIKTRPAYLSPLKKYRYRQRR